jgi:hypothetical protein
MTLLSWRSTCCGVVMVALLAGPAMAAPRGKPKPAKTAPKLAPPNEPEAAPTVAEPPRRPTSPRIALVSPSGGPGVGPEVTSAVEQGVERELRRLQGPGIVTPAEVLAVLGVERQSQLLGGTPGAALAALSQEATDVISVTVTARGADVEVLARRSPTDGSPAKTITRVVAPKTAELLGVARPLVAELFPEFPVAPELAPSPAVVAPKKGLRVAVLDPRIVGEVPARARAALEQSLTPEVRKVEGVAAINSQEIRDLLGAERQRQLLGCSEEASSCMEELAGAVGADELLTLDLTLVGRTYALTARRFDMQKAKVLQTHLAQFEQRDGEELLAIIGPTVSALYPERPLKPGAVRGVEAAVIRRLNPPPLPRWLFFTTAGLALASGAGGAGFFGLSLELRDRHQALAAQSLVEPVSAATLRDYEADSRQHFATATVFFAVAGGLAIAALVETFFTDWQNDRAALAAGPMLEGGAGFALSLTFR